MVRMRRKTQYEGCMYAGIAVLKTITCWKQLLRFGTDSGAVIEFDGEVDEIQGEGTYVDGVSV